VSLRSSTILSLIGLLLLIGCSAVSTLPGAVREQKLIGSLKKASTTVEVGDSRATLLKKMTRSPSIEIAQPNQSAVYVHYCLFGTTLEEAVGFWLRDDIVEHKTTFPTRSEAVGRRGLDGVYQTDDIVWNCYGNIAVNWSASPFKYPKSQKLHKFVSDEYTKSILKHEERLRVATDQVICGNATSTTIEGQIVWSDELAAVDFVEEAKKRGINCDTDKPISKGRERRLADSRLEKLTMSEEFRVISEAPVIQITRSTSIDAKGTIDGRATDNTGIAEIRIDNEIMPFDETGKFSFSTFIPPGGKDLKIVVYDLKGISSTKIVRLDREAVTQVAELTFDNLNPTIRRVKPNGNAIALIVGVAEYEKTAGAEYADRDAQVFYDYANLKLGIPQDRIQTLINDKADVVGLLSGINKWLKRSVKRGESDVYIFFAGHGLASDDGDTAYLIPYDGAPDFLERTAISRDEVFREVSSVNPRSVTVFLDTCYSGDTRGETRLIAGRPLSIKLQEQSLPKGFTVLTAAGGDQIAKPLKEAQHGMFSYFLMKGMEGGADTNSDNQITARELHTYVRENVVQQSGGSQVPELQGDGERVLVRFR